MSVEPTTLAILAAVGFLAYANGANDNYKGVATLFGSGTAGYRRALWLATVFTLAGSGAAAVLGARLIEAFSGKGLIPAATLAEPGFLLAVSAGAAGTVLLATRLGMPVSTTHAIVGALVGAGLASAGGVATGRLMGVFLLPLLVTPLIAVAATGVLHRTLRAARLGSGVVRETCVCIGTECEPVARESAPLTVAGVGADGAVLLQPAAGGEATRRQLSITVSDEATCIQRYEGRVLGLRAEAVLNALHYASAAAVSFARGLQDTAKIVGLLVGAALVGAGSAAELSLGAVSYTHLTLPTIYSV